MEDSNNINSSEDLSDGVVAVAVPVPDEVAESAAETGVVVIKFVPFASAIESAFWVRYFREKLETIQLNEDAIALRLFYSTNHKSTGTAAGGGVVMPPRIQCHDTSLLLHQLPSKNDTSTDAAAAATTTFSNNEFVHVSGELLGLNTLEAFKKLDKNEILRDYFLRQFFPSSTLTSPNTTTKATPTTMKDDDDDDAKAVASLNCTLIITFADLKSHSVVYWVGMPVLMPKQSLRGCIDRSNLLMDAATQKQFVQQYETMRRQCLRQQQQQPNSINNNNSGGLPPYFIYSMASMDCVPLSKASYAATSANASGKNTSIYFGFVDPLGYDDNDLAEASSSASIVMGWPMRNLVAYLSFHLNLGGTSVHILSYRPRVVRRISSLDDDCNDSVASDYGKCIILAVQVPTQDEYVWPMENATDSTTTSTTSTSTNNRPFTSYKVVGWELNARSKPGPRSINLRPLLDPHHLAVQAADLNLKLMKWRMIPNLQVDRLQQTKVLLIGAGTLGCNVARVLLGWGIRHFTIVDYGTVSYSNPVRQSLFTLDDCHADGGKGRSKAVAAAEALKSIAPDVISQGITLSIPMPGHAEHDDAIHSAVSTLDELIRSTDVVFLLTDTRESRWLPSVIAASYNKLLINAALGLDSWLVMRHGPGFDTPNGNVAIISSNDPPSVEQQQLQPQRHGCYFCSDVVAPENSTKNRTLDQQCTVTRPGLALIASSMAVELMVAVLHHPRGVAAPSPPIHRSNTFATTVSMDTNDDDSSTTCPLGYIPHQIRGSLVTYTMMTPTIPAFRYCTGCSRNVVDMYRKDKMGLVVQCCQTSDGSYLEDIAGLTAYLAESAEKLSGMEGWEDEDDEEADD